MPSQSIQDYELWSTLENDQFRSISEEHLLKQIYEVFTVETDRLKCAEVIEKHTPPQPNQNGDRNTPKPSYLLFDEDFDEVNRTYTGILAFRWVWAGDYFKFTSGQPAKIRLTEESFKWLQKYFHENVQTSMDILAIILAMVVNDVGKDPALVGDYYEVTGTLLTASNHDTLLLEAARAGMLPSLEYLDEQHRKDVLLGLELGSELNAGQLAQAENVPVNLEGLLIMENNERAFNFKFIEQILDVAGAVGHVYAEGSKNFIEPVFQAFKTVQEVSLNIIRKESTLREAYDQVLSKRADLLVKEGYRYLDIKDREQRALLRLMTMGRAATLEEAELFEAAFQDLDRFHKDLVIDGLNIDAIHDNETAVIPYYMPAMIAETIRSTKDSGKEQEALTSLMRYLSRTLKWTDEEGTGLAPILEANASKTWPLPQLQLHIPSQTPSISSASGNKEGRVIERNMSRVRDTINSPQFRENPRVLDALDPPKGQLLTRRRTSQSN